MSKPHDPTEGFYSAGYFIIKAYDAPDSFTRGLMPNKLLSVSKCFCTQVSVGWGWEPGDRDAALKFGIREEQWEEFRAWSHAAHPTEMGLWEMFHTPEAAVRFVQRFLKGVDDIHVIGVGIPHDIEATYWRTAQGHFDSEDYGVEHRIDQHLPMASGGQFLGFDVAGFMGYGNFECSWWCNHGHYDVFPLFGPIVGNYGLFKTENDAKRVYDWIAEDKMQGGRAEPQPYYYWLLMEYPVEP